MERIVTDLQAGSVAPDRIIVMNNNPEVSLALGKGVDVINSMTNFECRAKYIIPLLDISDYYLLMDDDTSVGFRTLEHLLSYAHRGCCFGYLGCFIDADGSFHHGDRVWPHEIEEETPVQSFCGCAMFMAYDSLVRMLILDEKVRLDNGRRWPTEGDDILAGLANLSTTIPMHGEERFVDLGAQGVAMFTSVPDYYKMRDRFVGDVLQVLETFEIPKW